VISEPAIGWREAWSPASGVVMPVALQPGNASPSCGPGDDAPVPVGIDGALLHSCAPDMHDCATSFWGWGRRRSDPRDSARSRDTPEPACDSFLRSSLTSVCLNPFCHEWKIPASLTAFLPTGSLTLAGLLVECRSVAVFCATSAKAGFSFPLTCRHCGRNYDVVEQFLEETHATDNLNGVMEGHGFHTGRIVEVLRRCTCGEH
jgi:hypothetical protein